LQNTERRSWSREPILSSLNIIAIYDNLMLLNGWRIHNQVLPSSTTGEKELISYGRGMSYEEGM
jgi:hypothetical protein